MYMQKMKIENLLIVSGLCRNIGKTELVSQIIRQQYQRSTVYGIKVSVIGPDPASLLSCHQQAAYRIFEETNAESGKDTSRMLQAGAAKVFYLQADAAAVKPAFDKLLEMIPAEYPIVCESNSLGEYFAASLHILLTGPEHDLSQYQERITAADLCITSDRHSGFIGIEKICFTDGRWKVQQPHSIKYVQEEK